MLWGSVLAAVAFGLFLLRFLTRERVSIHTAQVSYQDLVMTTPANGKVEPVHEFEAHAQAAGIVQDIYVSTMEKVRPGQLLLRMDDADAKASLARAQSLLRAAELAMSDIEHGGTQDERNTYAGELSRAKIQREQDAASLAASEKLQALGDASPAEVAAARQRLETDDSNLHSIEQHSTQRYGDADRARAQAQLADAQAAVAAAQSAVAGVDIRSQIAGTVYNIPVSQYDYVPAGDNNDLIYVADLNRLQVTAYFDEPEVGNLADGQPVKIAWEAKPNKLWHGHITTAPTTIITYGTRNVGECLISVDDPTSDLLPNTNVTVTVTTAQRLHVLSVPREAVHTDSVGSFVFRVIDNKLVRTPVQVGIYNLTREEILSGLSEGDTVALNATTNRDLSNGLQVKPVE
jgi:HlyD family secretion protein